ncbi:MAG: sodium:solute symporter, partial [Bacteroidaceae bacterium]|nr:sodium:solute symporter [Bacteroidaceae bacterium]
LPDFIATGAMGQAVLVFFTIGIIASAFSSADSALTALTTSFCIDILGIEDPMEMKNEELRMKNPEKTRKRVHLCMMVIFVLFILGFKALNNSSVIDAIYTIASYTYGPLLGLFAFGMTTRLMPRDKWVPLIAILSPVICFAIDKITFSITNYQFGYEMLMFNGILTYVGLLIISKR